MAPIAKNQMPRKKTGYSFPFGPTKTENRKNPIFTEPVNGRYRKVPKNSLGQIRIHGLRLLL